MREIYKIIDDETNKRNKKDLTAIKVTTNILIKISRWLISVIITL